MKKGKGKDLAYQVGLFRYGIISELLARPPSGGELAERLREMAGRTYVQPWDEQSITVGFRTLERWFGIARASAYPSTALQPKLRNDRGSSRVLRDDQKAWLARFRRDFPSWSVRLLYDNLIAAELSKPDISYSTVLRHLKANGFLTKNPNYKRKRRFEVRSFEVAFVGEVWHMDFHHGSRKVIAEDGEYKAPICAAIVDDKSRLVCHAQWFFQETAEVLVHVLIQAIQKRGLPRTFYSDCGAAMRADEFTIGLEALSIKQERTLPYSPYQNGKQEAFWQPLEGRLMKMLPQHKRITLDVLNAVTQAWVEQDYHTSVHSETGEKPLERFFDSKDVLRPSPDIMELRRAFRIRVTREQRRTDGTVTLDGVRFEIPAQYQHMETLSLRYARWDLGEAEVLCPSTNKSLCTIYPVDLEKNAIGMRKRTEEESAPNPNVPEDGQEDLLDLAEENFPPLLVRCLRDYKNVHSTSGYLPLQDKGTRQ